MAVQPSTTYGGAGPGERTDPPIKAPAERRAAAERLRTLWNIKEN